MGKIVAKIIIIMPIMLIVTIPMPRSIIYPKITGDNALANTAHACNKALTVPRLSKPYNSAHKEPIKGALIPIFRPNKDKYINIEI